jgi:hypothetical protein
VRIGNSKTNLGVSLALALTVGLAAAAARADEQIPREPVMTSPWMDAVLRLDRTLEVPSLVNGTDSCRRRSEPAPAFVPSPTKIVPLLDLQMSAEATMPAARWVETLFLYLPDPRGKRDDESDADKPSDAEARSRVATEVRF